MKLSLAVLAAILSFLILWTTLDVGGKLNLTPSQDDIELKWIVQNCKPTH
jgi:hypothetical protein